MDINKLKNKVIKIKNKYKLRRFYIEKFNHGKSYGAFIFDKIFAKILLLIAFIIIFYYLSKDINFSIVIAFQFFALYLVLSYKLYKTKLNKSIHITNERIANKHIIENLINKSPSDFLEYIKNSLGKYNVKDIKNIEYKDIDFIGDYKNNKVGIKCFQYNSSYKVSVNNLRTFFLALRLMEVEEGIVITTSEFDSEAIEFVEKVKKYVAFHVIDSNKVLKILKSIDEYPSRREIEKIIINQINERTKILSNKRKESMLKGGFVKYFFTGIFIIFIGKITPYGKFYKIMGFALITFSFIIAVKNIVLLVKPKVIESKDVIS